MRVVASCACFAVAVLGLGCGLEGGGTSTFAVRDPISLGILDVSVLGWEEVRIPRVPLSTLRAAAGEKPIAVFVRWSGLDGYADRDRHIFVDSFLSRRVRLVDADGHEYEARGAMPRNFYLGSFEGNLDGPTPRDWVAVFHAWVDSQGYSVRVQHPDPGPEEFHVAVIPLR
jgi:hypothetical protein